MMHYHPAYLKDRKADELKALTQDQVKAISEKYPFMNPDLRVRKKNDPKAVISPATWKSFYNLIRSGHPFEIVGTKWGDPKETIEQVVASVQDISAPEFVAPERPVFVETEVQQKRRGRPKKNI